MTTQARQVLRDCHKALELLENEKSLSLWRVHWAGALALLRAVGNVLHEVDFRANPLIAAAGEEQFLRWRSNLNDSQIFFEFIKKDRDLLLKEYEFNVHPSEAVSVVISSKLRDMTGNDYQHSEIHEIGENIYRPILSGPWEGHDARDAYKEALDWWEHQLDELDATTSKKP